VGEAGCGALLVEAGCGVLVGEAGCVALLGKAGCGALQENVGDGDCPGTGRQLVVLVARDDRHLPGAATQGKLMRQWREMTVTSPELQHMGKLMRQ
jgi:hypothetical protein